MRKQRLVVVGNGMAGACLVEEVLERNGADLFEIVVFGDEPHGSYNRILLSGVLADTHDPRDIVVNSLRWYEQNGVTLHAGRPVDWIDRLGKAVCSGRIVETYDKLVIAVGSRPLVPPIKGLYAADRSLKRGIFVFRTLDDCRQIASFANARRKAVVVGGGLLGLEAAYGLLKRGLEVHVVHLAPHLMETQLDAAAGAMLKQALDRMGVHIHLGKITTGVFGEGQVAGLAFQDGTSLECEMVIIAAGMRPNVGLPQQAGLTVERGIVVGDDLSCRNDPDIYAIGECAQHQGKVYGLVAPAREQARVLAERLSGRNPDAVYKGSKASTKLKVMGIDVACMGEKEPEATDEVVLYSEPARGVYKKLLVRDGRLAGAILLGEGTTSMIILQAFERETGLPDNRTELLFPSAAATPTAVAVAGLPDDAQVCNCNGVSKGKILAAVRGGQRGLKAVCDATRAGTGCGSCKPQVRAIIELVAGEPAADDPSAHYYVPAVPLTKPELIRAIKEQGLRSVSAVFNALSVGGEDADSKMGLASLLRTIWAEDYEDERDARFINDRVHANIQKDGTFSVVPRIYGGVTTPEQLRHIAEVAQKHNVRMVKITGGQRIDLLGLPKEKLPDLWKELKMPSGHAYTRAFRTCKTCVGTDFCRYGLGDSIALGVKIEKRFQGIEAPHKMKLATTGCPRNCSEATTKDLGAVAVGSGRWEVYVGGAAGSRVRKGDLLCVVDAQEDVLKYMGRFIQYYREHAKYQERSYDLVERVGVERLRRLLVNDAERICQRLDANIQAAVDAYVDPWEEAANPVHPSQFVGVLATVDR